MWGVGTRKKRDRKCEALSKRLRAVLGSITTSKSLQLGCLPAVHTTFQVWPITLLSLIVPKFVQMGASSPHLAVSSSSLYSHYACWSGIYFSVALEGW